MPDRGEVREWLRLPRATIWPCPPSSGITGSDDTLVLLDLLANPFGWSAGDAARRLGWRGTGQGPRLRATRAVNRLAKAGLVERTHGKTNTWRALCAPVDIDL